MDSLDKHQRYRLKNIEGYRARKNAYSKTPEQREKRRLYMIKWRQINREKHNQAHRDYHRKNRDWINARQRSQHMQRKYGLSQEQYKTLVVEQAGCCKICGTLAQAHRKRSLHIDHSHITGEVRGLLCISCNTALGKIEAVGIERFVEYLKS